MESLGHLFTDRALLDLALTHASVDGAEPNERLEFLGDAVLDLIVAEWLYVEHPEKREGDMTKAKGWIVSRKTLADAARDMGLWEAAKKGRGLEGTTPSRAVLANLYEAFLGAIYLDGGLEPAKKFALMTLSTYLVRGTRQADEASPKQALQEHVQARGEDPPRYELLEERSHLHVRAFRMAARVGGQTYPAAWGRTRKEAEGWAAHEALLVLRSQKARARTRRSER
ncbi:Ribonuclease 3 [Planctomycetes bacterium Pla163]|uniref:Ribonuclease 3 n=1 Tax=Rohdeia mirabilis TaxID=2528008 RepID=A0A518D450_9BACT|nr:Ribonuclease 3 [Planctomycetes bacterium Pla163]